VSGEASIIPKPVINLGKRTRFAALSFAQWRNCRRILRPHFGLLHTDFHRNIQRKSATRRTACDERPQKASHETRFVLDGRRPNLLNAKDFSVVGAPGLEPGTR